MNRSASTGSDLARQIVVISAVVFMIIAAMVGVGLFGGTNVRDLQGGALDADATVLAPGRSAFSIWSVIYILMIAYAVWQAVPGQRARDRQRRAGWWIALTAVLNGGWQLAAQFLTLPATVIAIVVLWNPVLPFPFTGPVWAAAQPAAAIVFLVAGALIKVSRT